MSEVSKTAAANSDDSVLFSSLFQESLRFFLSRSIPVYLNGFGILFTKPHSQDRSYQKCSSLIVRKENYRTIEFEKCASITNFHRQTYPGLIELKELSERILALLPIEQAAPINEKIIRARLSVLIGDVLSETVIKGCSNLLSSIGTFYALHNRQGNSLEDWFAGSDIFISSNFAQPISVGKCIVRERPILESAWELLGAAFGEPLIKLKINLTKELKELGYDISELPNDVSSEIPVAIFQSYSKKDKTHLLIYSTDGLRTQGITAKRTKGFGTEMVFQLPVTTPFSHQDKKQLLDIPRWPLRPLVMGWILMQSSSAKVLKAGLKIREESSLIPNFDSDLSAIFCTQFSTFKEEQLSTEGSFFFVNIVGITGDEHALAERNGSEHLRVVLEYKKLSQFTKPLRSSLTSRSTLKELERPERSPFILRDPRLSAILETSRSSVPI